MYLKFEVLFKEEWWLIELLFTRFNWFIIHNGIRSQKEYQRRLRLYNLIYSASISLNKFNLIEVIGHGGFGKVIILWCRYGKLKLRRIKKYLLLNKFQKPGSLLKEV